jgi:hypothetical protein
MTPTDVAVAGFESERVAGALVMARPEAAAWCREALVQHGSLYSAAMNQAARHLRGRGPLPVILNPAGVGPEWVVCHYQRGGGMRFLDDRFVRLGVPRSLQELDSSVRAQGMGIKTPRVVAAAVYPVGLFYRADLITEFVSDARELADVLLGTSDPPSAAEEGDARALALYATDRLIAGMVTNGVRHPDLNARNILLARTAHGVEAVLLDLDRCAIRDGGGQNENTRQRQRLARSIRKLARSRPGRVDEEEMGVILGEVAGS